MSQQTPSYRVFNIAVLLGLPYPTFFYLVCSLVHLFSPNLASDICGGSQSPQYHGHLRRKASCCVSMLDRGVVLGLHIRAYDLGINTPFNYIKNEKGKRWFTEHMDVTTTGVSTPAQKPQPTSTRPDSSQPSTVAEPAHNTVSQVMRAQGYLNTDTEESELYALQEALQPKFKLEDVDEHQYFHFVEDIADYTIRRRAQLDDVRIMPLVDNWNITLYVSRNWSTGYDQLRSLSQCSL
ncbi:hypothetical protein F5B21DRAFT_503318 [Xylaria acuta]|nr:hypothetical protein F5B21DRAFT_503318 [Xylaria acuta]